MIQKDLTLSVGNIIWIIGIIFTMGIAYSQIAQLDEDIIVLEKRLEKKIKIINECEDRIVELEKELATIKNCKND
jgi:CII-binding regulator of phage lambda lysogenization HflD|tara:strand:- start:2312 stop:2536 length:225 start_codon:yes stop_codon:yes gene_type:complete